jgi:hypothetical protein
LTVEIAVVVLAIEAKTFFIVSPSGGFQRGSSLSKRSLPALHAHFGDMKKRVV